jgi:hypothetical protein
MNSKKMMLLCLLLCLAQVVNSQEESKAVKKEKVPFETGFAVEGLYRNFASGTYLGDTYQMGVGYRMMMRFGFKGYPGLGLYMGGQGAKILDNRFLGDFFEQARASDSGLLIYYDVPIVNKFSISTDVGMGSMTMVHGESGGRFRLDYRHYFANLGAKYILLEKQNANRMSLTFNVGSGWLIGNQIRINLLDREYVRRATDVRTSLGLLFELF